MIGTNMLDTQSCPGLSAYSPHPYKAAYVREGDLMIGHRFRDRHTPFVGDPHEDHAVHLLQMCRGPWSSPCILFGLWFSLCESAWVQVSSFCLSSFGGLESSGSLNLSSYSFTRIPDLCLMFGCRFLHLFPPAS